MCQFFLEHKQKIVSYHKEYKKTLTLKRKRSIGKKMKHKALLQKERRDEARGVTYKSGVNLLSYFLKGK